MGAEVAKRGRRPAGSETRSLIIEAAKSLFASQGYHKATLRGIAREAGVDAALIHHYFKGKPELFAATFDVPMAIRPMELIERLFATVPRDQIGAALLHGFLTTWDPPEARSTFVAMARATANQSEASQATREFLGREVLGQMIKQMNPEYKFPDIRASLMIATLYGLGMSRWVNVYAPIANASIDQLVWYAGPAIQYYLDGPIIPENWEWKPDFPLPSFE